VYWGERGSFLAVYVARVRITIHVDGATIIREGHGTGEGRGVSPGEGHDITLDAAETDATKRALATFGKPFRLELYRNGKSTGSHCDTTHHYCDLLHILHAFEQDESWLLPLSGLCLFHHGEGESLFL